MAVASDIIEALLTPHACPLSCLCDDRHCAGTFATDPDTELWAIDSTDSKKVRGLRFYFTLERMISILDIRNKGQHPPVRAGRLERCRRRDPALCPDHRCATLR